MRPALDRPSENYENSHTTSRSLSAPLMRFSRLYEPRRPVRVDAVGNSLFQIMYLMTVSSQHKIAKFARDAAPATETVCVSF